MPGLVERLRKRFLHHYPATDTVARERWARIQTQYTGRNRHYHNLEHLGEMFDRLDEYPGEPDDRNILELAIFYHDLIYRAHRKDNELRSAQEAQKTLLKDHYPATSLVLLYTYILATKDHVLPEGSPQDLALLLDLDLAILGSPTNRYLAYTRAVRKEYGIFPDFIYRPARKRALEGFLARPHLYQTAYFRDQLDTQARANIAAELMELS